MREEWEREASLRLRDGDAAVLADYDRHGRLAEGTAEQMGEAAYRAWLADHLAGRDTLLIASTNEQAAELAGRARAELAALGLVEARGRLPLSDGAAAGRGDLVQARRNDRDILDADGRWAANRDLWRIDGYAPTPGGRQPAAVVRRYLGRDDAGERRWGGPFEVPAAYLEQHAVLGYAGTVHAAEGRTVDTAHAVVTESLGRALVYVAMTRGRDANYAYVATDPAAGRAPDPARALGDDAAGQRRATDLRPGTRPAPALDTPGRDVPEPWPGHARATGPGPGADAAAPWAPEADRLSVLAAALEREETEPTAIDARRDDAARAGHMAHLGAIWADLAAEETGRRCDAVLRRLLTPDQHVRYLAEDARSTLHRQVRTAELAGHPAERLLARAAGLRPLDDDPHRGPAGDISRVLHSRIRELAGDPVPRPATFAARTPTSADPETGRYLRQLAAALDARAAELGRRAAARPPGWALARLGPVPAAPAGRDGWIRRAGAVAAYREEHGHADPGSPIGREPASPEARAAWHAAAAALGADPRGLTAASDGDLHALRAAYERALAWAPPHVGEQLRATALARREHQTEAILARARANAATGPGREQAEHRAAAWEDAAARLAAREPILAEADARRARWHAETAQVRDDADRATAELYRRGRPAGPYRDPHHHVDPAGGPGRPEAGPRPARLGRPGLAAAGLAAASFPVDPRTGRLPGPRPPAARPPGIPLRRPPEPPHRGGPEAGR
jgi:hypothetical protein